MPPLSTTVWSYPPAPPVPGLVPPISSSNVDAGFEGQARDGHRTGIAGRKSAAAIDSHCTCRAGPADRAAVVNSDCRIAVRTVNDESAVFDCGVAAVRIAAGKRYGSSTVNNNAAQPEEPSLMVPPNVDEIPVPGSSVNVLPLSTTEVAVSGVARQRRERIVVKKLEAGCLPVDRATDAPERQPA